MLGGVAFWKILSAPGDAQGGLKVIRPESILDQESLQALYPREIDWPYFQTLRVSPVMTFGPRWIPFI